MTYDLRPQPIMDEDDYALASAMQNPVRHFDFTAEAKQYLDMARVFPRGSEPRKEFRNMAQSALRDRRELAM